MTSLFADLSVRSKALASSIFVVLVISVFTGIYYPARQRQRTLAERHDQALSLAEMVGQGVGIGLQLHTLSIVNSTFTWARQDSSFFYARVVDETGAEFAIYNPTQVPFEPIAAPSGLEPVTSETADVIQVAAPIFYANRRLGTIWIGVSLAEMHAQVARDRSAGLLVTLGVLLAGAVASLFFAARIVGPIEHLREAAERIQQNDYDVAVEVDSTDEIGALGTAFNTMARRLRESRTELALRAEEREVVIDQLQQAIAKVKTLSGLLPICATCKEVRDDEGYWTQIETYISNHSDADFSHGICPDCYSSTRRS